jgi:hypothetical protein
VKMRIDKTGISSGDLEAIEPLPCNSGAGCMTAMIAQGVALYPTNWGFFISEWFLEISMNNARRH